MENYLHKLIEYIQHGFEFMVLSLLVTAAGFFIPGKKKNFKFAIAAIILGTVFGLAAKYTPMLEQFQFIASILGAAVGPKTLASMDGRTLKDVLKEYITHEDKDAEDSTGPGSGVEEKEG